MYVQDHTYIMFILMCMYMNCHTFRMKFYIRNRGGLSLPAAYRKPSFCGGTNPYGAFCEEKILECSILYQAGIVYKKENIWLINSMLCEIFLENIVRA